MDDGSKEDIKNVVDDNFSKEARIRYFYKENEERGAARNFGLQQARGDYAVFFDSDDWMLPHYLESLEKTISENPDINLLAAKYNYNHNGKIEKHPQLQKLKEGWYERNLFLEGNILACNYCIRIKNHPFKFFPPERELASMEDWLFLLANLESDKIFIRDKICVTMRQHVERSMSNNQKVIKARWRATDWALKNLSFSDAEEKKLIAWSHYFCGVHQYLDFNKFGALQETMKAIRLAGIHQKFISLLFKSIIGKKLIARLK